MYLFVPYTPVRIANINNPHNIHTMIPTINQRIISSLLLTYNIVIFWLKKCNLDCTSICRIATNNTERVEIININTCLVPA